jgi:hypothetical protein
MVLITIKINSMKKSFLTALFISAFTLTVSAQTSIKSIVNNHSELIINDSLSLKKGGLIQIYLPVGKDFVFVKQKKSAFNAKLLGNVATIVGTGAAAVGAGTGNFNTLRGVTEVMNKANAVKYGASALEQVQSLPISNEAKKLAGTKLEIVDWEFTDNGYLLTAKSDKKKYEINLQEAIVAGEVKIN